MEKDLKSLSRETFNSDKNTYEAIQAGCLQRIADATEVMARRFNDLIAENESLKRTNEYLRGSLNAAQNEVRGKKGQITKLKNQLKSLQP